MKVILLDDVQGLGKRYEVKDVSDGHARHYLLPRKLAKLATAAELRRLEEMKKNAEKEEGELKKRFQELARRLNERYVEFQLKTDKHGSVFGSITKEMILKAMREHGLLGKERAEIQLDRPIKSLGDHIVAVDLKKGISAKLKIIVRSQP